MFLEIGAVGLAFVFSVFVFEKRAIAADVVCAVGVFFQKLIGSGAV